MSDRAPIQVEYDQVPRPGTRLGRLALVAALMYFVPINLVMRLERVGISLGREFDQRLSNFIFDFGALVDLFLLLLCVAGLIQRGDRRTALVALVVFVLGTFLMFV